MRYAIAMLADSTCTLHEVKTAMQVQTMSLSIDKGFTGISVI